mgnify:CR=1 FL=1
MKKLLLLLYFVTFKYSLTSKDDKMRKISTIFIFTVLAFQVFADYPKNLQEIKNEEYLYLDELALLAGTDKSSAFHHYTKVYADYFGPIKNDPLIFLEMGIYKGNSVKLWES